MFSCFFPLQIVLHIQAKSQSRRQTLTDFPQFPQLVICASDMLFWVSHFSFVVSDQQMSCLAAHKMPRPSRPWGWVPGACTVPPGGGHSLQCSHPQLWLPERIPLWCQPRLLGSPAWSEVSAWRSPSGHSSALWHSALSPAQPPFSAYAIA